MRPVFGLCIALAWPAAAAPVAYTLDPEHSQPSFEVSHLRISTYRGKFTRVSGSIVLDAEAGTGTVTIDIDPSEVQTGSRTLDRLFAGEDLFHTERHPRVRFDSDRVLFEAGVPVRVEGRLTLLGVTRPLNLEVRGFRCVRHPIFFWRQVCGADATAVLRRSEWGMTRYIPSVGDEVRLLIPVEAFVEGPRREE